MQDINLNLRFPPGLIERIERWRHAQPAVPSRTEAIRYLLRSRLDELLPVSGDIKDGHHDKS